MSDETFEEKHERVRQRRRERVVEWAEYVRSVPDQKRASRSTGWWTPSWRAPATTRTTGPNRRNSATRRCWTSAEITSAGSPPVDTPVTDPHGTGRRDRLTFTSTAGRKTVSDSCLPNR